MSRSFDLGFFSSPDRGLDCLIGLIPRIEAKLGRKVTSVWAYGFDIFDKMHKGNGEMGKFKWNVIRGMHDVGMVNKGRISHEELAKLMQDTKVLGYSTQFEEISMITMMKVLAAGMHPVSTGVAAVKETQGGFGTTIECDDIYSNAESQERFVDAAVKAIQEFDNYDPEPQKKFAERYYWETIAKQWSEALCV